MLIKLILSICDTNKGIKIVVAPAFLAKKHRSKVNNRNSMKKCEICSKLTMKAPERRQWHYSGVFTVIVETYFATYSGVSIVDFEQINVCLVEIYQIPFNVFQRVTLSFS